MLVKLMPRVQWLTEIAERVFGVPECLRLILQERPECKLKGPQLLATKAELNGWHRQMSSTGSCPSSTV
jgi:hypothetical protein